MFSKRYRLSYLPLFYVVIDDNPDDLVMEVRRFLFNRQNRDNMV